MRENGWHSTDIRVRYKDTDLMGVVYYGNYLTFFEVARGEYMRDLGLPYSELEAKGYSLAVIEASARYHSNVGYDSLITVKSAITEIKRARMRFDYEVYSSEERLLVTGHTIHACVSRDLKPGRIPEEIVTAVKMTGAEFLRRQPDKKRA
jgi:acyl-CoA thioester hydrolase